MMKAQGEKIRSWDEVNGQDEKTEQKENDESAGREDTKLG